MAVAGNAPLDPQSHPRREGGIFIPRRAFVFGGLGLGYLGALKGMYELGKATAPKPFEPRLVGNALPDIREEQLAAARATAMPREVFSAPTASVRLEAKLPKGFGSYETGSFKIDMPVGWTASQEPSVAEISSEIKSKIDEVPVKVGIIGKPIPSGINQKQYAENLIIEIKKTGANADFFLQNEQYNPNIRIDGQKPENIIYCSPDLNTWYTSYIFFDKGKAWEIRLIHVAPGQISDFQWKLTADEVFDKMATSFKAK